MGRLSIQCCSDTESPGDSVSESRQAEDRGRYTAAMGLSYDFLAYSNGGTVDLQHPLGVSEAQAVVRRLFPRTPYGHLETKRLLDVCRQPRGRLAIGVFGDGVLIATKDAHLYDPDILNRRYFKLDEWPDVRLLTSWSFTNMFAYGRWRSGELTRCISVNPVAHVWRDDGDPDLFEEDIPVHEDHWLDLSNAALASALRLGGDAYTMFAGEVDWEDVALHVFARTDR